MKQYQVLWTDDAVSDLHRIISYIYKESETIAKDIYHGIKKQCETLDRFPYRGHVIDELCAMGFTHYRELIYKRWRIIYSIENETVYLLLILDSRQDMEDLLVQRLLNQSMD